MHWFWLEQKCFETGFARQKAVQTEICAYVHEKRRGRGEPRDDRKEFRVSIAVEKIVRGLIKKAFGGIGEIQMKNLGSNSH